VRDRPLGVIGGTPGAVRYAQTVRQWTDDLVYFTPAGVLTPTERTELLARAIGVVEGAIEGLVVDAADHLRGVRMADGSVVPRDALFVPPRFVSNAGLLEALGCETDENGWVVTDPTGLTSVPGVWAAGNVVDPRAQIITAAGAGSAAAIALQACLTDPPPIPTRRSHHDHPARTPDQAPARADDLARGLPDPDRPQPGSR
jgi:thioredoxin reductase